MKALRTRKKQTDTTTQEVLEILTDLIFLCATIRHKDWLKIYSWRFLFFETWLLPGKTAKLKRTRENFTKFMLSTTLCNCKRESFNLLKKRILICLLSFQEWRVSLNHFFLDQMQTLWLPDTYWLLQRNGARRNQINAFLSVWLLLILIDSWIPRTWLFPVL